MRNIRRSLQRTGLLSRVAIPGALGLMLGLSAGVSSATNFGSNTASYNTAAHPCDATRSSQCVANGSTHRVSMASLPDTSSMRAAVLRAINTYNGHPDLWVLEWDTTTGADVNNTSGNFGNTSWWAYGACAANANYGGTDPDRWCAPQVITYNMTHPSNWDTANGLDGREAIACHEIGHTLGLRHRAPTPTSCMVSAQNVNRFPSPEHDWDLLTGQYH